MMRVGAFELHLINDGDHFVDPGGPFGLVPRALWSKTLAPVDDYFVKMVLNCLLVRAHGKTIVVDTGYGSKLPQKLLNILKMDRPNGGLVEGLARLGVQPADVDLVVCTHLHGDHAGGNTIYNADAEAVPTFPNAEYVVQQREYDDAIHPNERTRATYLSENYAPLIASGQLRMLNGDTELLSGIKAVVTPGHTPGHMSVRLQSEGEHAAFVCDLATYAVHFERLGWMTAYDVEPLITLETKRAWQTWALETNALLIFPHDPERPVGRLTHDENGHPKLDPVAVTYA